MPSSGFAGICGSGLRGRRNLHAVAGGVTNYMVIAMDTSSASSVPTYLASDGYHNYATSAGQWPSPLVGGQSTSTDAIFFKIPGGKKMGAALTTGLRTNSAGLYRAISDDNWQNWTLIATDTNYMYPENYPATPSTSTVHEWYQDDICIRLTMASSVLNAVAISTDGSQNYSTPTNTGLTGSWPTLGAPIYRAYARGTFIFITSVSGSGSTLCRVSIDSGANWTTSTCPGGVFAMEWDSVNGVFIAASKTFAGSWSNTTTIYTATTIGGTWTSRQTLTGLVGTLNTDQTNFRNVGGYIYSLTNLGTGGWTLYRVAIGSLATSNPFVQVDQVGDTSATSSFYSCPKLLLDGSLRYVSDSHIRTSTTGGGNGTWSNDTTGATSSQGGQMAVA